MAIPENEFDAGAETPLEDYLEQQQSASELDDSQPDEEAVSDTEVVPRVPVEADEADVVEQSLKVPLGDDYLDAEPDVGE